MVFFTSINQAVKSTTTASLAHKAGIGKDKFSSEIISMAKVSPAKNTVPNTGTNIRQNKVAVEVIHCVCWGAGAGPGVSCSCVSIVRVTGISRLFCAKIRQELLALLVQSRYSCNLRA